MIPNCPGCEEEWYQAEEYAKQGFHPIFFGLGERKHLSVIMVDNNGKPVFWTAPLEQV